MNGQCLGLAHVGDGVYELLCRSYLCLQGDRTVLKLHKDTVELVKAPTQAALMEKLLPLMEDEKLLQDAAALEAMLKEKHGVKNVITGYVGPVIGAHAGPGTLALFFLGQHR